MNKKYESMSMVEVAVELQIGAKEITFQDLYKKVCDALEFSEEEVRAHIAQFYTDVTASGDFIYCGGDKWDLKRNQKLSAQDSEFYQEHLVDEDAEEDEEEEEKPKARRSRKKAKTLTQDSEGNIQEVDDTDDEDSEDQSYENISDDYEVDESEEYDTYEKDFDSSIDDDEEYDEDDEDEDKYNEIMDDFEDLYDN